MKKIISLLMVFVLVIGVTGCGKSNTPTSTSRQTKTKEVDFNTEGTIQETVLYDQDGILIKATDIEYSAGSFDLNIAIENNTQLLYSFIAGSLGYSANSINGYMVGEGYFNEDVEPGDKVNASMRFKYDELQLCGINGVACITPGIYFQEDGSYKDIIIDPVEIKTSIYDGYDYSKESIKNTVKNGLFESALNCKIIYKSEEELYSSKKVKIQYALVGTSASGDKVAMIEIENNSDFIMEPVIRNVKLDNIVECYGTYDGQTMYPGKKAIMAIKTGSLVGEHGAFYDMDKLGTISFDLILYDENGEEVSQAKEIALNISKKKSWKLPGKEVYNNNGVVIYAANKYDDEYQNHMLFLVENKNNFRINADIDYSTVYVDDVMARSICFSSNVNPGQFAILDLEVYTDSLPSLEGIKKAEFTLEIKDDNYHTMDEAKIVANY
ncbi:MAG: hypothetical protein HUJ53_04210 [Holdemanella sp.]|nr:hypothetical protein [Holdemanella sp.]